MNPKLVIRDTKKYGKGVFANKDIKKNETLCVFGGHIKGIKEESKLPSKIRDEGVQISENFSLGVINEAELEDASYFNHSCDPNAGFKGQILLVAMRKVGKGEQVTFDYAMALSKVKGIKFYKIKCFCNAKRCRKFITDNDWKNPILRKKYNGFFQWYLQDKIINSKK